LGDAVGDEKSKAGSAENSPGWSSRRHTEPTESLSFLTASLVASTEKMSDRRINVFWSSTSAWFMVKRIFSPSGVHFGSTGYQRPGQSIGNRRVSPLISSRMQRSLIG